MKYYAIVAICPDKEALIKIEQYFDTIAFEAHKLILILPGADLTHHRYAADISYFHMPQETTNAQHVIHAGILLTTAPHILFIDTTSMPNVAAINNVISELKVLPYAVHDQVWGVNRESIILDGFDCIPGYHPDNEYPDQQVSDQDILQAASGQESNSIAIAKAMIDVLPTQHIYTDHMQDTVFQYLVKKCNTHAQYNSKVNLYLTHNIMRQLKHLQSLNSKTMVVSAETQDLPPNTPLLKRFKSDTTNYVVLNSQAIEWLIQAQHSPQ